MTKEEKLKKRTQLKVLSKMLDSLNFEAYLIKLDKEKTEEEKEQKLHEIIEKMHGVEVKINEMKRNKFNSEFYEFKPFVGLNRKQRRSL